MASSFSTRALVNFDIPAYKRATQSEFLLRAASGDLSKQALGHWLANDYIYIHGYIQASGKLLSFLQLPELEAVGDGESEVTIQDKSTTKLLAWVIDALVNIQREKDFFVKTAARYGINISAKNYTKLEGLKRFEAIFANVKPEGPVLPWLEGAMVFYATEKCYVDAWTWAKEQQKRGAASNGESKKADGSQDEDGGAVRLEFIDNWTNKEFVEFVDNLGEIIDEAIHEEVSKKTPSTGKELQGRCEKVWMKVLTAEQDFWPQV